MASVALADDAPAPTYDRPAPSYSRPAAYQEEPSSRPVYAYAYDVRDDYSGNAFGASETRDGYATSGEYRVALPDGRTQIVTYTVSDAHSGFVADVRSVFGVSFWALKRC